MFVKALCNIKKQWCINKKVFPRIFKTNRRLNICTAVNEDGWGPSWCSANERIKRKLKAPTWTTLTARLTTSVLVMSGYFKYSQKRCRRAEGSGCSTTSQANLEEVIWDQFKADSHTGYRTNKVQRSFFCVLLHACVCIDPRQTFPFCHLEPTLLLRQSSGSTRDLDPTEGGCEANHPAWNPHWL